VDLDGLADVADGHRVARAGNRHEGVGRHDPGLDPREAIRRPGAERDEAFGGEGD
jgi:hypothetical protein